MKKSFKVNGIDCPNCAAKLEKSISKIDGVDSVKVTFMTQKLTIEAADEKFGGILEEAIAITKKLEPEWEIVVK